MDDLSEALAGNRVRFGVSFLIFLLLLPLWLYLSPGWNSDIAFAGLFVHDLLLVSLLALRFRQLRMNEAWAFLAFLPFAGYLLVAFLLVRNNPAPERYSAF